MAKCHCIDTSKNEFRKYHPFIKAGQAVMKIVWRNPNPINRTSFSIVKTLAVEQPDELRVFYRSSRGPGAREPVAPYLSDWSTVTRSVARHDPNVNHSVSFLVPTRSQHRAARSFTPLQARKESQSRCKGKSVAREDVCFADMEVAVESSPVPA
jgi:hypothetical protein